MVEPFSYACLPDVPARFLHLQIFSVKKVTNNADTLIANSAYICIPYSMELTVKSNTKRIYIYSSYSATYYVSHLTILKEEENWLNYKTAFLAFWPSRCLHITERTVFPLP